MSLRPPPENELPSPHPSPSDLGEGVFAPKNFCLPLARFTGEGWVRVSSTQHRNFLRRVTGTAGR